jgi:hypothetical protein
MVEAEEVWRAGGPREDRMLEWYRRAKESDKPDAAGGLSEVLTPLFHRRWLDPTPFAMYEQGYSGTLNVVWKQELAVWRMTAAQRRRVYSDVLRAGKLNDALGLGWLGVIYRALDEHMDDLLPEIEAVLEHPPELGLGGRGAALTAADIRAADLPLAYARSGDWKANYLKLIREKLEAQAKAFDGNWDSVNDRIIRNALLELVHSGDTSLLAPLKALWRSIKPPAQMEEPENQRIWERLLKQGLRDPEYNRDGPAADCLVLAIQALGDPMFQEKNTLRRRVREDAKKRLVEGGYLRPAAATH